MFRVVFPVYKSFNILTKIEQSCVLRTVSLYRDKIIWISPENFNVEDYLKLGGINISFPEKYFKSPDTYSELLKLPEFYKTFSEYIYICIIQQDVWIFEDKLNYFCSLGYDYIGAPWYGHTGMKDGTVGNGGYSLRKISSFVNVAEECKKVLASLPVGYPEDLYFGYWAKNLLKIAPEEIALQFSFEEYPEYAYGRSQGKLPSGTHAFLRTQDRLNFWKEYIPGIKELYFGQIVSSF